MAQPLPISGTFLDEVTCDIPGHNWGAEQWAVEFDSFVAVGIDTVILIRSGWGPRLSHPTAVLRSKVSTLPVYADMVELFLNLADARGIAFYFGLYDSGSHWNRNDWQGEVALNRPYIPEVYQRYGAHPSFAGWYLPHETYDSGQRIIELNTTLAELCKAEADLPVLSSPYWLGRHDMHLGFSLPAPSPRSLDEIVTQWDEIFSHYSGLVDVAAFQDGTVYEQDLPDTLRAMRQLADRHNISLWSNVETFDRDMPIKFPPIEWRKLIHKLTSAEGLVDKAICFEFSHFLSPNSIWPSGRNLFARYQEYLAGSHRPLT
ncbi:MAG: DUF4434 domain-containing protein [Bifidobacteriaceae bacterium]|jgi:hypothetical protein|nr:DUF4434 domain-containing protein [Bifidobacteriaceae bacterium]